MEHSIMIKLFCKIITKVVSTNYYHPENSSRHPLLLKKRLSLEGLSKSNFLNHKSNYNNLGIRVVILGFLGIL